jgi:hypothetical protein
MNKRYVPHFVVQGSARRDSDSPAIAIEIANALEVSRELACFLFITLKPWSRREVPDRSFTRINHEPQGLGELPWIVGTY